MRRPPRGEILRAGATEKGFAMGSHAGSTLNLAGRAGLWSAAHWKLAAFGWIAFAVVAVAAGSGVGAKQMKAWAVSNGESRRAEQILEQGNFKIPARESVLVQSRTATVGQDAFAAAVGSLVQTLSDTANVTNLV